MSRGSWRRQGFSNSLSALAFIVRLILRWFELGAKPQSAVIQ